MVELPLCPTGTFNILAFRNDNPEWAPNAIGVSLGPLMAVYSGETLVQKSVYSMVSKNPTTSKIFPSRIRMYHV